MQVKLAFEKVNGTNVGKEKGSTSFLKKRSKKLLIS
jgi:hypothetical protein